MLKQALLYEDKLNRELVKTWGDPKYMHYYGQNGSRIPEIPDNCFDSHHFVSIDEYSRVIGYITYRIDYEAMSVDDFAIISFETSIVFARDVYQVVYDLFEKYHMNRVEWCCYADNPAIRGYRNFIKKHGGRECGYHKQVVKLMDNKLHDRVDFEIMADDFRK